MIQYILPYIAAALIAYLGYRARALTWDGAGAACLVGGTIYAFGGWEWALLLVVFFASSSALSFVGNNNPRKQRAAQTFDKGGKRDAMQVLANGGVAAAAALFAGAGQTEADLAIGYPDYLRLAPFFALFVGALAAATADTWATEIGVLSRANPKLVTTWRKVEAGTSGAITALGSIAGLLGGGLIGLVVALLLYMLNQNAVAVTLGPFIRLETPLIIAVVGGMGGMLADSLLGATVQAQYYCPTCNKPTESRIHRCGTATTLMQGVRWINNDIINLLGTLSGGLIGFSLSFLIPTAV